MIILNVEQKSEMTDCVTIKETYYFKAYDAIKNVICLIFPNIYEDDCIQKYRKIGMAPKKNIKSTSLACVSKVL